MKVMGFLSIAFTDVPAVIAFDLRLGCRQGDLPEEQQEKTQEADASRPH